MNTEQFDGHSPGPWTITARNGTWVVHSECIYSGEVATMNDYEDAKLIAAAPELLAEVKQLRAALSECLWLAETDGTSFGTEFPLHDIIGVCNRALNDEEDEEE